MKARINNEIFKSFITLIDEEGKSIGEVPIQQALSSARELNLDLVEVGQSNNKSICKIMDFGKWKYEQLKKQKKNKSVKTCIKEIKIRPNIGSNDLVYRAKHIDDFLKEGNKVKVEVVFRGRELNHMRKNGEDILNKLLDRISSSYKFDGDLKMNDKSIVVILMNNE